MLTWFACFVLAADPAELAETGSGPPEEHPPGDPRFRPRRRGLLLARRQDRSSSRPRRRTPATRSTRSSSWTWRAGKFRRVSPGVGKTTCSYFSPDGKKIIFASSHLDPDAKKHYAAEYQRREEERQAGKRRRYVWDFDPHMDIFEANPDGTGLKRLTDAKGYDAEGSYSPDGKQIVFCSNARRQPASCTSWTPTARTSAS